MGPFLLRRPAWIAAVQLHPSAGGRDGSDPGPAPTLVPRSVCERANAIIMFTMYFGPTELPFVGQFRTVPDTTTAPEDMATWRLSPRTGSLPKQGSRTRPLKRVSNTSELPAEVSNTSDAPPRCQTPPTPCRGVKHLRCSPGRSDRFGCSRNEAAGDALCSGREPQEPTRRRATLPAPSGSDARDDRRHPALRCHVDPPVPRRTRASRRRAGGWLHLGTGHAARREPCP